MDNYIAIDSHECKLKEHFSSHSNIKFTQLDIGDIILYRNNQPILVIERKSITDLYSSIKDGRWREQKARLLGNFPQDKILYLVEDKKVNYNCLNMKTIHGSIINTLLRDKIKILFSKSINDTVLIINILLDRLLKKPEFFEQSTEINYCETLKIKKKDNMTPETCQQMQLAQIPGVSVKIAEKLLNHYGTLRNIMLEDSIDPNIQVTDKRKLGKVLAERVQEYLLI